MTESVEGFPAVYLKALKARYDRLGRDAFRKDLCSTYYGPDDADQIIELCEIPRGLLDFDDWASLARIASRQVRAPGAADE